MEYVKLYFEYISDSVCFVPVNFFSFGKINLNTTHAGVLLLFAFILFVVEWKYVSLSKAEVIGSKKMITFFFS